MELEALRDSAALLSEYEAAVFMLSLDTPEKNRDFAASLGAELVLLSDTDGTVGRRYGVVGLGGFFAQRWTFYIDREGTIRRIDKQVKVGSAGQDIARQLGELGFPKKPGAPATLPGP